jgi:hypothetical protein
MIMAFSRWQDSGAPWREVLVEAREQSSLSSDRHRHFFGLQFFFTYDFTISYLISALLIAYADPSHTSRAPCTLTSHTTPAIPRLSFSLRSRVRSSLIATVDVSNGTWYNINVRKTEGRGNFRKKRSKREARRIELSNSELFLRG